MRILTLRRNPGERTDLVSAFSIDSILVIIIIIVIIIRLEIRKKMWVVRNVDDPFLEIFKARLDEALSNQVWWEFSLLMAKFSN